MLKWVENWVSPLVVRKRTKEIAARLNLFASKGVPVFLDDEGEPRFCLERGPTRSPAFICTIPKSGSYLFSEILRAMGLVWVNLHLADWGFSDKRFAAKETARTRPEEQFRMLPPELVLPQILPGQFLMGHLPHPEKKVRLLQSFKVLFTYRNLRDCLVSFMRFMAKNGLGTARSEDWARWPEGPEKMERYLERHGKEFFEMVRPMRDWIDFPRAHIVSFEEILGDHGREAQFQAVRKIMSFLELTNAPSPEVILQEALGKDTHTFSGARTNRDLYWTSKAEDFFQQHGGSEMEHYWQSRQTAQRRAA